MTKSGGSSAVVKGRRMNRKSLAMSDVDDGGLSGRPRLWTHHRPLKTRWWGDLSDSWLLSDSYKADVAVDLGLRGRDRTRGCCRIAELSSWIRSRAYIVVLEFPPM